MSRDIWSPDDETVNTGVTNSMRRYQSSQCEQVNSIEKHKVKPHRLGGLRRCFSAEERKAFLDRERAELPSALSSDVHKVPAEIVREIKELNKTKQPRGFWACYAKTHCIMESAIYHIRAGRQYKDVV